MLRSVELIDFKSFERVTVPLGPFTVLVGANASGKSNFLDALRFLQGIARGYAVGDVLDGREGGAGGSWPGIRGGAHEALRTGCSRFTIGTQWDLGGDWYSHSFTSDGERVLHESLSNVFEAVPDPTRPAEAGLHVHLGPGVPERDEHLRDDIAVIGSHLAMHHYVTAVSQACAGGLRFMAPDPAAMRRYNAKPSERRPVSLAEDGSNLSAVLWHLCRDHARRSEFVSWVQELCAPEIAEFDFIETEADDVLLVAVERNGRRVTAKAMSDGTLRFLALLAAVKTAPRASYTVIEDLEHGIHPTRLGLLLEAVESCTIAPADGDADAPQVIATTHSPELLEALSQDALGAALLFARPPGSTGSVVARLAGLPAFEAAKQGGGLRRMLASGWLEHAV